MPHTDKIYSMIKAKDAIALKAYINSDVCSDIHAPLKAVVARLSAESNDDADLQFLEDFLLNYFDGFDESAIVVREKSVSNEQSFSVSNQPVSAFWQSASSPASVPPNDEELATQNGFQLLQASYLPSWLKQRWSSKIYLLQAINQGYIRFSYDPESHLRAVDRPINLRKLWPKLTITIECFNPSATNSTSFNDTISLQGLLLGYQLTVLNPAMTFDSQAEQLAYLEILEIFLSTDCLISLSEGLACLNNRNMVVELLDKLLDPDYPMKIRSYLLGIEKQPINTPENVDSDQESDEDIDILELSTAEKKRFLTIATIHLTPIGLLIAAERLFPLNFDAVLDADAYLAIIQKMFNRAGLTALRKGYLTATHVHRLCQDLFEQKKVLAVIDGLFSDQACLAFYHGLIALPTNIPFYTIYRFSDNQDDPLILYSRFLLTDKGRELAKNRVLDIQAPLNVAQWCDQLTQLNTACVNPVVTNTQSGFMLLSPKRDHSPL